MDNDFYQTIEQVWTRYKSTVPNRACLFSEDMKNTSIEILVSEKGLEVFDEIIRKSGRSHPVEVAHSEYDIKAHLMSYHNGKAVIMIYGMKRKWQHNPTV